MVVEIHWCSFKSFCFQSAMCVHCTQALKRLDFIYVHFRAEDSLETLTYWLLSGKKR